MNTIKITFLIGAVFLFVSSCKTKVNYNQEAYTDIMDNSVRLLAKEEKGKAYPTNTVSFPDSLYLNNQTKLVVDSINNAKDLQIKTKKY